MALQSEYEQMAAAWRALAAAGTVEEGWRTIPLTLAGAHSMRAGRHFPGNEEALLVGFSRVTLPPAAQLPQGQGFRVTKVVLEQRLPDTEWLALSRRPEGSIDMFTMMATDVIATLRACGSGTSDQPLFALFLSRIRAWQEFMRRGADSFLSPEAEVGLFGELLLLRALIAEGVSPDAAVQSWVGPLDQPQDFAIGTGAVEAKSTIATVGFSATIGSLEQLDDATRQPLFVAAIRLRLDASGESLPDVVDDMRGRLGDSPSTGHIFNTRLLDAGYLDGARAHYTRSFVHLQTTVLPVTASFPRLTRSTVPLQVTSARYSLELDQIPTQSVDLPIALRHLGVI